MLALASMVSWCACYHNSRQKYIYIFKKGKNSNCLYVQEPEDLFETISQAMLNAVDRDAVSGMGVVVHVM